MIRAHVPSWSALKTSGSILRARLQNTVHMGIKGGRRCRPKLAKKPFRFFFHDPKWKVLLSSTS